jgi:hypothetical protein
MPQITRIYLTSRLSTDNVVVYNDGNKHKVNVKQMIHLVDNLGASEIQVFIKDNDNTLRKRIAKLILSTVYGFGESLGFTDNLSIPGETYASNYFVITITKQIFEIDVNGKEIRS